MKAFCIATILAWASVMASASTLDITGQTENVDQGGQFSANLNGGLSFFVYCVDFRNFESPAASVNISTPLSAADIDDTRYGTTPSWDFSYFPLLSAQDRYVQAAWLTTQYNFTSGVTLADKEIQNAIWTLLTVDGTSGFPGGDAAGTGTYLVQAGAWELGAALAGTLSAFEADVQIYTSTNVASVPDAQGRYVMGSQEMISVSPEPGTVWLGVCGLGLILFARARQNPKQR